MTEMASTTHLQALDTVWNRCTEADWTGWDPYDGLMTGRWPLSLLKRSRLGRLALIQAVKRSPGNLRPLLDIPPLRNPKALALGLEAACRLAPLPGWKETAVAEANRLTGDLLAASTPTREGHGWGYPFDWQARAFWIPRGVPTVVCTGFVVRALHASLRLDPEGERAAAVVDAIEGAARFVLQDLNRSQDDTGFCWSYSPLDRASVVNATLLGAEIVARAAVVSSNRRMLAETLPAISWALARQRTDGGWAYGEAGHHRWEDAFHTGFNLMSMLALREMAARLAFDPEHWVPDDAIDRAANHYAAEFFDAEGRPWYYRHSPWPLDPHAAAVALIVLRAVSDRVPAADALCDRVLRWTLDHLWSEDDGFVVRLERRRVVQADFLRWCQAWMLLALADRAAAGHDRPAQRDVALQPVLAI